MKRRDFIKILGITGGLAARGLAAQGPENIIPYLKEYDQVIPGLSN